jgi:putative acetyltransferase
VSSDATPDVEVRQMRPGELSEMLDLWVASWQAAYPAIDFAQRREWMSDRLAELERTGSHSFVATRSGRIIGALIVNPETGYLDQIVVAADLQGGGIGDLLLDQARRLSPERLELHVNKDNARAIGFYEKNGFIITSEDINPRSGAPIYLMRWEPG